MKRKSMKRCLVSFLCVAMLLGTVACGAKESGETASESVEKGENVEEGEVNKDYEIAVIAKNAESQWGIRQEEGVNKFAEETGITAYQKGPSKVDASAQLQLLEDVIAQGVDAICIVPVDIEAVDPALQRARDAGIIVIANEGIGVKNKDYSLDSFNNEEFGCYMMDSLAEQMGEKGTYTTMVGSLSNGSHNIWMDAAVEYQKEKYPEMQLLDADPRIESADNTETAYEKTKELLKKYPDLGGIIGASSADLPGIAKAVDELGIVGQVAIAGLGTPGKCAQFLQDGSLKEICGWDPSDTGYAMCSLAVKLLDGEEVAEGMDLGIKGYTSIKISEDSSNCLEGAGMIKINKDEVSDYDF